MAITRVCWKNDSANFGWGQLRTALEMIWSRFARWATLPQRLFSFGDLRIWRNLIWRHHDYLCWLIHWHRVPTSSRRRPLKVIMWTRWTSFLTVVMMYRYDVPSRLLECDRIKCFQRLSCTALFVFPVTYDVLWSTNLKHHLHDRMISTSLQCLHTHATTWNPVWCKLGNRLNKRTKQNSSASQRVGS